MWCVGVLDAQYRARMHDLLDLYARPLELDEPVVCIDEKSAQLLAHSRAPLPMKCGRPVREDYEYVRRGTCNLFVAVAPEAGRRTVRVTERRGKVDFVAFVRHLVENVYGSARRIHPVSDNLNTTSGNASRRCWAWRPPRNCCAAFASTTPRSTRAG